MIVSLPGRFVGTLVCAGQEQINVGFFPLHRHSGALRRRDLIDRRRRIVGAYHPQRCKRDAEEDKEQDQIKETAAALALAQRLVGFSLFLRLFLFPGDSSRCSMHGFLCLLFLLRALSLTLCLARHAARLFARCALLGGRFFRRGFLLRRLLIVGRAFCCAHGAFRLRLARLLLFFAARFLVQPFAVLEIAAQFIHIKVALSVGNALLIVADRFLCGDRRFFLLVIHDAS